jgi:anti-anti-sigma regulatory factor
MCRYVFKILRSANGEVVLTLIGRMSDENLPELKSLIASERKISRVVLDLKDVTLVDREAVHFLERCETNKITLKNCPPYIRDWIDGSRKRKPRRKK